MATLYVSGHVNDQGQIQLDEPLRIPPGDIQIIIETASEAELAADDAQWDAQFAGSADLLRRMASQALADDVAGRTVELDFDELDSDDP